MGCFNSKPATSYTPTIQPVSSPKSTIPPVSSYKSTIDYSDLEDLVQRTPGSIRRVLLLGPPASGKSTFINCLANYFLGGSLTDLKIVIPNALHPISTEQGFPSHSESHIGNPSMNHTQKCAVYKFKKNGVIYRFFDTPGLSDSIDNLWLDRVIATAVKNKLSAIILVIKSSDVYLNTAMATTLQRINTYFPDILLNNLVIVYTHYVGSSLVFEESSLPCKPIKFFVMNNSAFSVALSRKGNEAQVELFWKASSRKSAEVVTCIELLTEATTEAGRNIQEYKNDIKTLVMRATGEIEKPQYLLEILYILQTQEIEQNRRKFEAKVKPEEAMSRKYSAQQEALGRPLTELKKRKQALQSMEIETLSWTFYGTMDTPYHNTLCRICQCTCHENCSLPFSPELGNDIFKQCVAMNDRGQCQECKLHMHDYTTHIHARSVYVEVTLSVLQKKEEILNRLTTQTYRAEVESDIDEAKTKLAEAEKVLEKQSRVLKLICTCYDFKVELELSKQLLSKALEPLQNAKVRKHAIEFIGRLTRLAEQP